MNSSKERTWLAVVSLLILGFSSIPNWVGYASETKEFSYRGIFFDPQDYAVHMSMLRAGMEGDRTYQFRFTTESHTAAYTRGYIGQVKYLNRRVLEMVEASLSKSVTPPVIILQGDHGPGRLLMLHGDNEKTCRGNAPLY